MRLTLFLVAASLVLMIASYVYIVQDTPEPPQDRRQVERVGWWQYDVDKPAPDFELTTLSGDILRLSDMSGSIVVLNFWATWCAPCRRETPAFVRLQKAFEKEGVQFVGVSVDEGGPELVRSFVQEFAVPYPIAIDDGTVQRLYPEITGLPTTYVINREGQIEGHMPGEVPETQLRWMLNRLTGNTTESGGA